MLSGMQSWKTNCDRRGGSTVCLLCPLIEKDSCKRWTKLGQQASTPTTSAQMSARGEVRLQLLILYITLLSVGFIIHRLWKAVSIDGNWKICYPHCMWQPSMTVSGFSGALKYVSACPNQPEVGKVFCSEHCQCASTQGVPTSLQEFIKYSKGRNIKNNSLCMS